MRTPDRSEAGIELLLSYYNQLTYIEKRFYPPGRSVPVYFSWYVLSHTLTILPNYYHNHVKWNFPRCFIWTPCAMLANLCYIAVHQQGRQAVYRTQRACPRLLRSTCTDYVQQVYITTGLRCNCRIIFLTVMKSVMTCLLVWHVGILSLIL